MTIHARRRLRVLAVTTLITCGGAILSLLLTIAFPMFGMPQPYSGPIYIPPQAYLVVLLVPLSLILALASSISGLNQGRRAKQAGWTTAFAVLLLLLLLGPVYLICSFGAGWSLFPHLPFIPQPQDLGWQASDWWLLASGSAVLLVLTAICALVYAARAGELFQSLGRSQSNE